MSAKHQPDWRHAASAVLLAGLLTACGQGSSPPTTTSLADALISTSGPAALPLPRDLPSRQAAFDEFGLLQLGSQLWFSLPHNRLSANGRDGDFTPDFSASRNTAGLAYGIYGWNVDGYNRDLNVRLNWTTPPATGECQVGLANFATNRWEWHALPAVDAFRTSQIDFSNLAAYTRAADGMMFAVVAVTGSAPASLRCIRIGAHPLPMPNLTRDSYGGHAPTTVNFDAALSTGAYPVEALAKFEFDFGDGSGFVDNGTTPTVSHQFLSSDDFTVTLRTTDVFGGTATVSVPEYGLDELEPNNGASMQPLALPVIDFRGEVGSQGFYDGGSADYFSFSAGAGQTVTFTLRKTEPLSSTFIAMYADTTPLARWMGGDQAQEQTISYTFTGSETGPYYIILTGNLTRYSFDGSVTP